MFLFGDDLKVHNFITETINERRSDRSSIFPGAFKFNTGDILIIIFWVKNYIYRFEGLCICLRKKNFIKSNVSLILRNVLLGVGLEFCISYYFNRIFFINISDYKRKKYFYRKAKLYYVRLKLNRSSHIKGSI